MDKDLESFDPRRFKPISEGLGLNHFADGLPYSPTHLKRKPMVQFNFPPPRAPRLAENESKPVTKAQPVVEAPPEFTPAGFLLRGIAYTSDVVFLTAIFALVVWAGFALNGFDIASLLARPDGVSVIGPLGLLYVVVYMGYFLIQETTWKKTLGKALFGIHIRTASGFASVGRAICFFISAIPFGVGLVWCLFDSKRRCWHDVITDSEVVLD